MTALQNLQELESLVKETRNAVIIIYHEKTTGLYKFNFGPRDKRSKNYLVYKPFEDAILDALQYIKEKRIYDNNLRSYQLN